MMTNLVKKLITNLRYPLRVACESDNELPRPAAGPLSWTNPEEDILEDWDEYEFLTGYDLYSLDDDNCSFHLWEEDDDFIEGYEEDAF
jgi:hypothetical protein